MATDACAALMVSNKELQLVSVSFHILTSMQYDFKWRIPPLKLIKVVQGQNPLFDFQLQHSRVICCAAGPQDIILRGGLPDHIR